MPQLDATTYLPQLFWLVITFIGLYAIKLMRDGSDDTDDEPPPPPAPGPPRPVLPSSPTGRRTPRHRGAPRDAVARQHVRTPRFPTKVRR